MSFCFVFVLEPISAICALVLLLLFMSTRLKVRHGSTVEIGGITSDLLEIQISLVSSDSIHT